MADARDWKLTLVVFLGGLAGMGLHSSPAQAHEFWLAPSAYVAHAGDTVRVSAFSGTGFRGEARRYAQGRVVRFVAAGAERTDLADNGVEGDSVFASLVPRDAGGLLIAYESNAASLELPAAEFDRYLEEDGLDVPRALRRAGGVKDGLQRERYARCAKTWVSGPSWRRACTVTGLTLELVPVVDPGQEQPLSLRVLFRGRPLVGGLVRAWRQPLEPGTLVRGRVVRDSVGFVTEARSDGHGVVHLRAAGEGEWLISCVHMVRSDDLTKSDWQSWWASLTFGRPTPSERRH